MTESKEYFHDKLQELLLRAQNFEENLDPDPPDEETAMRVLRRGFGPTVSLYVEARTGGRMVEFKSDEFTSLELVMNDWLEMYSRCYGYEVDHGYTVREAAELLVETRNIRDTAEILTQLPDQ